MDFVRSVEAVVPGAQGRVLAVLAEATAPLNLSVLARLSGVSPAQVSRAMPGLVRLGLVERTEVPPSSLFVLVRDHVAAVPVLALARSHDRAIEMMCDRVVAMEVQPVAVWLFGSFARREADVESDIDAVFVRPGALTADDEQWSDAVEVWRHEVRRRTGNRVEVIEATASEIAEAVGTNTPLWADIRRDCIVVAGPDIAEVAGLVDA